MAVTPGRKQPVCRTCNTPMAGHKRPQGSPICPTGPFSGSPAPERKYRPPPSLRDEDEATEGDWLNEDTLQRGRCHRPNRNWVDPHPPATYPPYHPDDDDRDSIGETEPISDFGPAEAHAVKAELTASSSQRKRLRTHDEDDRWHVSAGPSNAPRDASPVEIQPPMTERLVRMFSAATVELDDVHRFAKEKGMISGTLHRPKNPPASAKGKEKAVEGVQKQKSWWVMVGNREPIEHILQLQHRDDAGLSPMPTAPGYFHEHTYSRPSGCWFLEITGACCITAVFVCLALAYMPGRDN